MSRFRNHHFRLIALLIFGLFVIILTTQPNQLPLVRYTKAFTGGTALGSAMGHTGLFAALTAICYAAFASRLRTKTAIAWAMGIVLLCGMLTEFFQRYVPSRGYDVADLLANWLGVFIVGFIVSYTTDFQTSIVNEITNGNSNHERT